MSQCVPSWDLDESSAQPSLNLRAHSNDVPSLDYEVAELTWENGQLTMHGLGPPRVANKKYASWDKPCAGAGAGTLESIVNQATRHPHLKDPARENVNKLAPWFDHRRAMVNPGRSASMTMTMDALVPCNNSIHRNNSQENSRQVLESVPGAGTLVGSCSGAADGGRVAPARICTRKTNASVTVSESTAACGGIGDGRHGTATLDTCERELGGGGFTSTSLWSPENTSSGEEYTKTTSGDDHDSVYHSRSQRETGHDHESGKKKGTWKSSVSTKRSRAAAIHNQSERKRRDKINQRMKTLQKLVPNSSKTDKASILDEVIEYLKQLQAQVQMMSRMNMPHMMLPLALQQQLQMSMMAPAMGMGVMDLNTIGRAAGLPPITATGMPPVVPLPPAAAAATFMPMPSWDVQGGDRLPSPPVMPDLLSTFLACQSQRPMTTDAYSRLAALYQQFQQNPGSGSKNQL